jgi:hypothetical protein
MRFHLLLGSALALAPLAASAMGISVVIHGQTVTFKDVPESTWYSTYVHDAAAAGIVNGYQDNQAQYTGLFGPSDNVTVAQALKIAVEGAGYRTSAFSTDIDAGVGTHWAAPYVSVGIGMHFPMVSAGMNLDRAATRAEVADIFATAFKVHVDTQAGANYKDVSPASPDAPSIAALSRDKILSGDTDANGNATGTFRPAANINRAEVVKMVLLARAQYGEPGTNDMPPSASEDK